MAATALELVGIHFTYLPGTEYAATALHDVQLTVHWGEVVSVVGQAGAGKSTLLQVCAGLFRPSSGAVMRVLGVDVLNRPSAWAELRQRIGVLLQRPEAQLVERLVGNDVAFGPRRAGLSGAQLSERVKWAMEAVGLDFALFRDRRVNTLSGGELRKVALAGAIATLPDLLLLDEPTAGLDPISKVKLLELLLSLREEYGCTIVMSTTDMEDLPGVVDRVVLLSKGVVVADIPAAELVTAGLLLREHGLDLPETGLVVEGLCQRGLPIGQAPLEHRALADVIWKSLLSSGT